MKNLLIFTSALERKQLMSKFTVSSEALCTARMKRGCGGGRASFSLCKAAAAAAAAAAAHLNEPDNYVNIFLLLLQ